MTLRLRGKPSRSGERGNAMIEFAISFALLFPVFAGAYEFGYAFYLYNEMQTAVRAGARYASLRTYDSATETPSQAYLTGVRNMVVYGNPSGGAAPVVPGLAPGNVTVTVTFISGVPRAVTIGIANYSTSAVVKMLQFNTKPRVTVPYTGRFDPI